MDSRESYYGVNQNIYIPNGTSRYAACSDTSVANDETGLDYANPTIPNDWPADFNDNQLVNGADYLTFNSHWGQYVSANDPETRWDLNQNGVINGADWLTLNQFNGKNCVSFLASPPGFTDSRYMKTVDQGTLYQQGCTEATNGGTGLAILNWGQPSTGGGTVDFTNTPRTSGQILASVLNYMYGYYNCSPANYHIIVVVGTTNNFGATGYTHGSQWADLVDSINSAIDSNGWRSQIDAVGGMDAETGWSSATATLAWGQGYEDYNSYSLYYFGDAGGCPTDNQSNLGSYLCAGDWNVSDVAQMAWGLPSAYPIPQIYRRDGNTAAQWQILSLYSSQSIPWGYMKFKGELTQLQACQEVSDPYCQTRTTDNHPNRAWHQLWYLLNRDTATANIPTYSTDLTYIQ